MNVTFAGQIAWYLNVAATLVLLIALKRNGLYRIYQAFSWYLAADLLVQILALLIRTPARKVAEIYMAGQSLKLVLTVFVVLELYNFALAGQPAIAHYARRFVGGTLVLCAVLATVVVLSLPVVGNLKPGSSPILYYFYAFERMMDSAVLFFLILLSVVLAWFPVRVPRNVAIYIGGFVAYFLMRWAGLFAMVMGRRYVPPANLMMLSIALICLALWIALLRVEGEKTSTVTGHRWNPSEADRLMRQLAAFNSKLEQFSA